LREELTNLLLNFSSVWLALGLEVIVGRTMTDYSIKTLSQIIHKHLLNDESLNWENDGLSAAHRDEIKKQSSKLALKKLLMLVLLLDKAKLARLVPGDPCLFHRVRLLGVS
jgi:hypothetical protein